MENEYLIDTDIIIDHLRRPKHADNFLIAARKQDARLYVSVATIVELYSAKSALKLDGKLMIDNIVSLFRVVPLSLQISKEAGFLRAKYNTPFADAIIAATARIEKLTLVTRNKKHFSDLIHLIKLKIAN